MDVIQFLLQVRCNLCLLAIDETKKIVEVGQIDDNITELLVWLRTAFCPHCRTPFERPNTIHIDLIPAFVANEQILRTERA